MYHRNILIEQTDPELWAAIQAENARQEHHIELIASENYASPAVMQAQGSQLTNKYAEGYPGKRYYGGCEHVDVAAQLACTTQPMTLLEGMALPISPVASTALTMVPGASTTLSERKLPSLMG